MVSEDIYNQFIKLKERQDNNEIHSDEYIKFIKSDYPTIIKEMLKKNNLSASKFAKNNNIHNDTIRKWIYGIAIPKKGSYEKIKKYL